MSHGKFLKFEQAQRDFECDSAIHVTVNKLTALTNDCNCARSFLLTLDIKEKPETVSKKRGVVGRIISLYQGHVHYAVHSRE